ncbi:hypothetical protein [Stenotrophomonas sp. 24(2023)]|uniref:hypothetical protein n=1 Tax=Stenotrophomonas sp. 24(2023) TaxID=3068324 RepID=UPI0027E176D1|nr:hypothetical protein [Stenotrophomonas sp. 24(2023)]WMJ67696.1 hypothetical protein Q9R17_10705 [Stenotrophomonas sp. 24(2023)]
MESAILEATIGKTAPEDARAAAGNQTFPPYASVVFSGENAHPVDVQRPYLSVWPAMVEPSAGT